MYGRSSVYGAALGLIMDQPVVRFARNLIGGSQQNSVLLLDTAEQ
ncbi:hypothetical protein Z945_600 [Sulfitobacter noctilucae]|nr:hypothetical protein Z945_600 [Sulfitobacter noctilucae]